jgi:hypothetical protein
MRILALIHLSIPALFARFLVCLRQCTAKYLIISLDIT